MIQFLKVLARIFSVVLLLEIVVTGYIVGIAFVISVAVGQEYNDFSLLPFAVILLVFWLFLLACLAVSIYGLWTLPAHFVVKVVMIVTGLSQIGLALFLASPWGMVLYQLAFPRNLHVGDPDIVLLAGGLFITATIVGVAAFLPVRGEPVPHNAHRS